MWIRFHVKILCGKKVYSPLKRRTDPFFQTLAAENRATSPLLRKEKMNDNIRRFQA